MMKNWIKNLIYILPALVLFSACNPEIEVPAPVTGTADFSNYIAVGNSLTAGYADNGLYEESQMQSYPKLISQQMNNITSSNFVQPDIPGNGSGYMYLTSLAPTFDNTDPDDNWLNQVAGPFNNLGVPGIRAKDITFKGYGSSPQVNAFFYRMLGGKDANMSYLEMVQESQPSFFTSWIGNNDVLGYASTGGVSGIAGASGTGLGGLTPIAEFQGSYDALIAALTSQGGKGVVVTIPDITLAPYFTTVPYASIPLDEQTATALMSMTAFGGYNAALDGLVSFNLISEEEAAKRKVFYEAGVNSVLIQDNDLFDLSAILGTINPGLAAYGQTRQATDKDLILLPASSVIGTLAVPDDPFSAYGVVVPLGDVYVLTSDEIDNVNNYTDAYNDIIRGYASASPDIAILESNDVLGQVNEGIFVDGVNVDGSFILGGAFSLDGVHLTPRGYSIVANSIIDTINKSFNATLSPVIINNYRAVILP
jgi:hypothetical protein